MPLCFLQAFIACKEKWLWCVNPPFFPLLLLQSISKTPSVSPSSNSSWTETQLNELSHMKFQPIIQDEIVEIKNSCVLSPNTHIYKHICFLGIFCQLLPLIMPWLFSFFLFGSLFLHTDYNNYQESHKTKTVLLNVWQDFSSVCTVWVKKWIWSR